ncbi:MAG: hypothetical protein VXW49_03440 [Pseudomonadota bacterium]|nr:hypothetical protein [Pseudomonadota bacterium]MEC8698475.1 hypothetical protein [Pseudomonadota bacterium]
MAGIECRRLIKHRDHVRAQLRLRKTCQAHCLAIVFKRLGKNAMTFTDISRPFFMDHPQQFPEASRLFLVEARAVLAQTERAKNIAGCAQCDAIGEFHIGLFASAPFSISVASELIAF